MNMSRRNTMDVSGSPEAYIIPLLRRATQELIEDVARDLGAGSAVLDIGCGNQPLRELIEERKWSYTGLDVAQNDLNNVDIVGRIDGKLPTTAAYDLLLCTEVFEHVVKWEAAFANLALLSKSGARVIITAPFVFPLHEEPHDYWRPTPYAFEEFANSNGFDVVKSVRAGDGFDVLGTFLNSSYIAFHTKGLAMRVRAFLVKRLISMLKRDLSTSRIGNYASIQGNWYLSNVFLLKKR